MNQCIIKKEKIARSGQNKRKKVKVEKSMNNNPKITQKSITIFMTCLTLILSAVIIIVRIGNDSTKNYADYNQQIKEIDNEKIEEIWENSSLEGNRKEKSYYCFEIPIYRVESEKEAFSMYFRFYVVRKDGGNYLESRIIFGGFYNITELSKEEIEKNFSISAGKNEMSFDIFKDEKKKTVDGDSYNMMAFSTTDVEKLGKIAENKNVKMTIKLKDKKYEFTLREEERNKLKAIVENYLDIQKEAEKNN